MNEVILQRLRANTWNLYVAAKIYQKGQIRDTENLSQIKKLALEVFIACEEAKEEVVKKEAKIQRNKKSRPYANVFAISDYRFKGL